jgi:hypothetical protein
MSQRLFVFVQLEFPWALGPPDGRYVLRAEAGGEPVRVLVLGTLDGDRSALEHPPAAPAAGSLRRRLRRRAASRRRAVPARPQPVAIASARATIIDPVSLSAERQAQAWLADLDSEREEREISTAVAVLNRVLHAQRIAAADPYAREVSPAQAVVIRAGWGQGEQVADGRWLKAVELSWAAPRARRRRLKEAALRSQERLAGLLGARDHPLACEELALRARLDIDQGRFALAALELDHAYTTALAELGGDSGRDVATRVAELEQLRAAVAAQARAAVPSEQGPGDTAADRQDAAPGRVQEDVIRHALERLESALRARAAARSGHV